MPEVMELAPPERLRPWIDAFWTRAGSAAPLRQRVLPDGCADVIIDLDAAAVSAVGTMTEPLLLDEPRPPAYFGVRFRPGRAGAVLRMPLHELTDRRIALDQSELAERVAEAPSSAARAAVVEAWLLRTMSESDARIDRAVELLARGRSVDDVAREVNLSRQHLRRRFLEHVGVGPKTFARVARFQRLLAHMRDGGAPTPISWAAAAADVGYFDQSHLIADFRQLAGTTPVPFFLSPPP
jgi:AraC-like DNA-binding protein